MLRGLSCQGGLNRYAYCRNNPIIYTDPDGHFAWFIPVIIGAVAGAYVGGAVTNQDLNPVNWDWQNADTWYGMGAGALIGAGVGALGASVLGAEGLGGMAWGFTASAIGGANTAMGTYAGGQLISNTFDGNPNTNWFDGVTAERLFKNGLVGAGSGLFTATGGLGLMYGANALGGGAWSTAAGLLSQAAGTFGRSVGMNWANGRDPFSSFYIGVGPLNLAFRDGGLSSNAGDWIGYNIGNIVTNGIGLANLGVSKIAGLFKGAPSWLTSGNISWDWQNLTPIYSGGFIDVIYDSLNTYATGIHAVAVNSNEMTKNVLSHEMHHLWQSRMMGNAFLINYAAQGLLSIFSGYPFFGDPSNGKNNWFEIQGYGHVWF